METEDYKKFLNNTLLLGINELIGAQREDRVSAQVAGLPYEVYELLCHAFCTSLPDTYLPQRLRKQFDLNDPEVLNWLRGTIEAILALGKETFEKDIASRDLPQIVAAWEKAKELSEAVEKTEMPLWKKQIQEHNKRVLSLKEDLGNALAEEFAEERLTQEKAKIVVENIGEEIERILRKTKAPREAVRDTVANELRRHFAAADLLTTKAREHLAQFETAPTPSWKNIDQHLAEVSLIAQTTEGQARRIKSRDEFFRQRAGLAVSLLSQLDQELVESSNFRRGFDEIFLTEDPALVPNPQKFIEEQIVACAEKAGIETIKETPITEYARHIAKEAIPKDFFSRPEVPPLPALAPPTPLYSKTEKALSGSLEKALEDLDVSKEIISKTASNLLERLTEEERIDKFLSLETDEERTSQVGQLLTALFEKENVGLPEEKKEAIKNVTQETLPNLSRFLTKERDSLNQLKDGLKNLADSPTLFFTSVLPGPLKPVGVVIDVVGALFPKVKDSLLAGFFGGDRKNLKKIIAHYYHLLRENKREVELAKLFEETQKLEQLESRAAGLSNVVQALSGMEKAVKKPPLFLKPFISLGNVLRGATSFINKRFPHPLSIFSRIKNIDFSRFLPPFSPSLSANLRSLAGGFLHWLKPHLFIQSPAGLPVFKFSLAGLGTSLGNLFSGIKNFFSQKILGSSFVQGARALGGRLLTKLGLGGLTKIGLSLGIKALGATLSAGTTLLLEGGLRLVKGAFNFLTTGLSSLFGGFFGFGVRREEQGVIDRLGGIETVLAGVAVLAVVLVSGLSLLFSFQMATSFTARPYDLQEKKTLGVMEEKIATPSATPIASPTAIFPPR